MRMRRLIFSFALMPIACVIASGIFLMTRPPTFHSHNEVVAYLLRQRGIEARAVYSGLPWPAGVNYYAYGSDVYPYNLDLTVELTSARKLAGSIECQRDKYSCRMTIAALGIDRIAMPDISDSAPRPFPAWLDNLLEQIGVRL